MTLYMRHKLASSLLVLTMTAACVSTPPSASSATESTDNLTAIVHPEIWPQADWPYAKDAAVETRIDSIVARMSIEEKVGQVIQADIASVTPEEAKRYHLGSILNGGNSAPGGDEFAAPDKWLALADAFYDASVDTSGGRTAIPIIWGTDAVHGHSNIVGATLFPHNVGLGAMRDPALLERIAQATALELRSTGMEWTFAPTITVPQDLRWGRAYEGYSQDPALVASYVGRFIKGLQGAPSDKAFLDGPYVLASTKHFLADGGTDEGRDQGDAKISETELRDIHGTPYVPAINAGVQTIMASFSSWNGKKITGHKGLLTDVLKKRMRFGGFVVSDWNAHGQILGCTNASCPEAINAGLDMYMAPDTWKPLYYSLVEQAKDGTVPMARLDDAVKNILRVKIRAGLFEAGRPSSRPYSGRYDLIGSPDHRALAREAVRKSLVLIKNDNQILPLNPKSRILVAGDGADDIGRASGGWTLTWQGTGIPNDKFPGATSLWHGIKDAVSLAGGTAEHAPDGSFTEKPDAAIVIFGETPYAEFQGDLKTLQLKPELKGPLATMRKLKAQGIPVISVFLTGRPLWTNPEINASDAFVAAWLPGSEGGGVSDMLFRDKNGEVAYDFSGKLGFSWPMTADALGPKLFDLGYGLTTDSVSTLATLPEISGVESQETSAGLFFDKGLPTASWSLIVSDGQSDRTRITTTPAEAVKGRVQVRAVDHLTQEGARQFTSDGSGPMLVELVTHAPIDISRETNGDVLLLVTMRYEEKASAPVTFSMSCGPDCGGEITPGGLDALAVGEWQTVGVSLKCFANAGADVSKLDAPFQISTNGSAKFSLSRVAVGTVADTILGCE
ncbi:exo 1,3/1,4-beta-D-glucan glucohydrolase [Parasphingorhabdus sp.]|uniref:glycoside hydrolase family 3 protein n=1 Tax=Parasphingorhabdus sp. TaxID=2709688 RepID=UPI003265862B